MFWILCSLGIGCTVFLNFLAYFPVIYVFPKILYQSCSKKVFSDFLMIQKTIAHFLRKKLKKILTMKKGLELILIVVGLILITPASCARKLHEILGA